MDYKTLTKALSLRNEEALFALPKEETLDFVEYLMDNEPDLIDDVLDYAWYLKSYKKFLKIIRTNNETNRELQGFIDQIVYDQPNVISTILQGHHKSIGHILKNMEYILSIDTSYVRDFIDYAIANNKEEIINSLLFNKNLKLRGRALEDLVARHYELYKNRYSKDIEAILKRNDQLVPETYVSQAISFIAVYDKNEYYKLLRFILKNYQTNHLLDDLTNNSLDHYLGHKDTTNMGFIQEMQAIEDINILFNSYAGNRYSMYERYGKYLDPETQKRYQSLEKFKKADWKAIYDIFSSTIYEKLMDIVAKYASDHTGSIKVAGRGTKATAFIVGDKIIKCSNGKWVQDKTTSISSYLILKNIEEYYEYDKEGNITQAIEVQPYLRKKVPLLGKRAIDEYKKEFESQGLQCQDLLIRDRLTYQNLRYLNDYHEANCEDPELLPEWFKQKPIVLIDADEVIKVK